MKHISTAVLVLSFVFVCSACGDDDTPGTTPSVNGLPTRYAVEIPKTLKSSTTQPVAPLRMTRSRDRAPDPMAHNMVKGAVRQFKEMQNEAPMYFVIMDAILPDLIKKMGTNSEVTADDIAFTVTAEMLAKIKAAVGDEAYAKLEADGMVAPVGTVVKNIWVFTYKKLANDPLYDYLISWRPNDANSPDRGTMLWSADKTRTSVTTVGSGVGGIAIGDTVVNAAYNDHKASRVCTYDLMTKTSFMSFNCANGNVSLTLTQTNDAKHGVLIKSAGWLDIGEDFMKFTYDLVGAADDDGGYVEAYATDIDYPTDTYGFRETFDTNGANTGFHFLYAGQTEWAQVTPISTSALYFTSDPATSYKIASIKVNVSGLSSSCEYLITAAGTTTIDGNTIILGSGHYDSNAALVWSSYWGTEAQLGGAKVFTATWNGVNLEYTASTATVAKAN